ncbi:hypothetical protein L7F22_054686 [Adiantum nelumboides]|nr:hypothetical protein [Adiantum nelumboides]
MLQSLFLSHTDTLTPTPLPPCLMRTMELQTSSSSTRYVQELLPLVRRIRGLKHPASRRTKAKLIRLAADLCLIKAAGRHAKWGKALFRTLRRKNAAQYASPKISMIETVDAEAGAHCHSLHPDSADADADECRTFSSAKMKTSCDRNRRHLPRYRRHLSRKRFCSFVIGNEYIIARTPGLCYRYHGTHRHRGFSTLVIHQLQLEHPQAACGGGVRSLSRRRSWFKKSQMMVARPQHANCMTKKQSAQRSGISDRACAEPKVSSAVFIESNNGDENADAVHIDMAGRTGALQKLIPGGSSLLDPASLFEETALYILALQMQVHSLSALTKALGTTPTHSKIP